MKNSMNVNVSIKTDTNTVIGVSLISATFASIIMFISNQRTKRLEIKQEMEEKRYTTMRSL